MEELETKIAELEESINALEAELCLPEVYADYERASEITTNKETKQMQLEQFLEEWEQLQD
ncbi:hypothetical protein COE51_21875 [Bacillus pseudomycoides]|nr:hypothetical protein COE51_21875 [Bacillus pseudomycoides]